MKRIEALRGLWRAHRQRAADPTVLRNTLLSIVHPLSGPLAAIGEAFADNRLKAIAAAKYSVLRIALRARIARDNTCYRAMKYALESQPPAASPPQSAK